MVVIVVVIGIAVALSVAGWIPVVRDALRPDHILPGPAVQEATEALAAVVAALDPRPEAGSATDVVSA